MSVVAPNTQKMKFTKTETEYNMKSIRFLLLTITTMFIVIAGLMIVLGFSVYTHFHDFTFFLESAKSGKLFSFSLMSILLGMFLLVVTMFGFFGSLKQSTCLVNSYALILTVILILKMVVVILAFTVDTDTIQNYMYLPISEYTYDPEAQDEIDRLQYSLNCCGGNSYLEYRDMEFNGNHSTVVVSTQVDGAQVSVIVPASCCITHGDVFCTRMRATGCKTAITNAIIQNASVIGVLGVSVMFIQLLGIIFALLLARCIRKLKSEKLLMSWQMREDQILARENAEMEKNGEINGVYIIHADSSTA